MSGVCLYKVWCGYIKCGVAKLSWSVAISKSDFSVSLCQFSKKRSKNKIDKELDNKETVQREGSIKKLEFLRYSGWVHKYSF